MAEMQGKLPDDAPHGNLKRKVIYVYEKDPQLQNAGSHIMGSKRYSRQYSSDRIVPPSQRMNPKV